MNRRYAGTNRDSKESLELPAIFKLHPGEELIESYLTGHLGQADKDVVEVHLLLCNPCRLLCAETEQCIRLLRVKKERPS